MIDDDFHKFYLKQLSAALTDGSYRAEEFSNPHNPLWPQQSFDYPYGQAPEVDDLPPQELADWEQYVGAYYLRTAMNPDGTGRSAADQVKAVYLGYENEAIHV